MVSLLLKTPDSDPRRVGHTVELAIFWVPNQGRAFGRRVEQVGVGVLIDDVAHPAFLERTSGWSSFFVGISANGTPRTLLGNGLFPDELAMGRQSMKPDQVRFRTARFCRRAASSEKPDSSGPGWSGRGRDPFRWRRRTRPARPLRGGKMRPRREWVAKCNSQLAFTRRLTE